MRRRFPPPWTVEALDGGFKVVDANGQTLAYVYGHADQRKLPVLPVLPVSAEKWRPTEVHPLAFALVEVCAFP